MLAGHTGQHVCEKGISHLQWVGQEKLTSTLFPWINCKFKTIFNWTWHSKAYVLLLQHLIQQDLLSLKLAPERRCTKALTRTAYFVLERWLSSMCLVWAQHFNTYSKSDENQFATPRLLASLLYRQGVCRIRRLVSGDVRLTSPIPS